jgi:serine/threonine-protein kinase mTOR
MWAKSAKEEALKFLGTFCTSLSRDIGFEQSDRRVNVEKAFIDDARHLLARSFIKQGQWRQELSTTWTPVRFSLLKRIFNSYVFFQEVIDNVINCHRKATELDPRWYKAWHSWALCNFEAIAHLESLDTEDHSKYSGAMLQHILSAIEGELFIICMNPI